MAAYGRGRALVLLRKSSMELKEIERLGLEKSSRDPFPGKIKQTSSAPHIFNALIS